MKKVINNDAIEAIKKRYDTPLHQGIFLSLAGILRTKEKNKISEFALSKKDLGADLAAAPNIIISLCNYCLPVQRQQPHNQRLRQKTYTSPRFY